MTSLLMKFIGGVLAIILLVFVPLVSQVCIEEIGNTRENWNSLENYIDQASDKGLLTKRDYDKFISALDSNGILYEVSIEISRKIALPEDGNEVGLIYQPIGYYSSSPSEQYQVLSETKALKQGDILTVTCKPVNFTVGQRIITRLTKSPRGNIKLSLSAMVRNNGMEESR